MATSPIREFEQELGELRGSPAYRNYLTVREKVLTMLAHVPGASGRASNLWSDALGESAYMLDASPLIVAKLKHHAFNLTALRVADYRLSDTYAEARMAKLRDRLREIKAEDAANLHVPESPELGGFGFEIDGALTNTDTVLFYECLVALERGKLLDQFRKKDYERKVVVEIGAGCGGFAHQFKTLFPHHTYVIVDLPPVLLFSATYLKTVFPQARTLIIDGSPASLKNVAAEEYDFIFAPNYVWEALNFRRPDLVINKDSFQEMTTAQVDRYIGKAREWGVPFLYSRNRDRGPHNREITSVSEIMSRHYTLQEVYVLGERSMGPRRRLRDFIYRNPQKARALRYRHLIGKLPQA